MKRWIKDYFEINKREIIQLVSYLMIGIIIGVCIYVFSPVDVKKLAINTAREIFEISKNENYVKTNIILNGVKSNIFLVLLLTILSMTLFGRYGIYGVVILKGATVSIYTLLLFKIFGFWWGIVATLLLIFMVNIIYIPILIYLCISFLDLNFNIFSAKINKYTKSGVINVVISILISFIFMFSSVIVEQIASSVVLSIYSKL